jgi:hypothetical protein
MDRKRKFGLVILVGGFLAIPAGLGLGNYLDERGYQDKIEEQKMCFGDFCDIGDV